RIETVASIPGWLGPSEDQPDAPARGSAASVRSAGDRTLAGASGRYPTGIRAPPEPQRDPGPVTSLRSRRRIPEFPFKVPPEACVYSVGTFAPWATEGRSPSTAFSR